MTWARRVVDRARYRVSRGLVALPPGWQLRVVRQAPIHRDGLTLDPSLQMLLALRERLGVPAPGTQPPEVARARVRREAAAATGRPIRVGAVTDITVADGLPARHYAPDLPGGPHPLLVFLHGGGFVVGDLDTHDQACRLLCRYAGVHVVAVDYRLAPEHPFPAAVEDACAALDWAFDNAARLGADPARVAVGGDSAGGNLAAVAVQAAGCEGARMPALQVLIYPTVDRKREYPSLDLFAEGFFLTRAQMDWFDEHYCGGTDSVDPRLCPVRGEDLSGLAPALVVTAGFDPLRDEGEAYAAALADAGVPTTLRREPAMIHGFINMVDISPAARTAFEAVARETGALLRAPHNAADPFAADHGVVRVIEDQTTRTTPRSTG